jgi:hypothetical protein
MTASENSFLGLAKQTARGTPNTTDASFEYLLYTEGTAGPSPVVVPLDPEVGGGAMLRSLYKVGVTSGGGVQFIPRPQTLGYFLHGVLGTSAAPEAAGTSATAKKHVFSLKKDDQFNAPYYTVRSSPGSLWGEQLEDCRISALVLEWRAASFVRATAGIQGGKPKKVATTSWAAVDKVDGGPAFLSPLATIEVPTGSPLKVLSGSFTAGLAIPLDEQWIVGSYYPDAQDITSRAYALSLNVKLDASNADLYYRALYDSAANAGGDWTTQLMREADIHIAFKSDVPADGTTTPATDYALTIHANGDAAASGTSNVVWTARPVGTRAGSQIVLNLTGVFLASPDAAKDPITVELVNLKSTPY